MISLALLGELLRNVRRQNARNKAFQRDKVAVSHLLQKGAKAAPGQLRP